LEITRFGEENKHSRVSKPGEHGPSTGHMGDKKKKKGKHFEAQNIDLMIEE
jgi:hypothetical protein